MIVGLISDLLLSSDKVSKNSLNFLIGSEDSLSSIATVSNLRPANELNVDFDGLGGLGYFGVLVSSCLETSNMFF